MARRQLLLQAQRRVSQRGESLHHHCRPKARRGRVSLAPRTFTRVRGGSGEAWGSVAAPEGRWIWAGRGARAPARPLAPPLSSSTPLLPLFIPPSRRGTAVYHLARPAGLPEMTPPPYPRRLNASQLIGRSTPPHGALPDPSLAQNIFLHFKSNTTRPACRLTKATVFIPSQLFADI